MMMFDDISVKDYERALKKLSESQIQFLIKLFYEEPVPNMVILSQRMGYKDHSALNLQIGKISNAIKHEVNYGKAPLKSLLNRGKQSVVHIELRPHDAPIFWDLKPNLREAMINIHLVTREHQ